MGQMVRCKKGHHFFDPTKYHDCPDCRKPSLGVGETRDAKPKRQLADAGDEVVPTRTAGRKDGAAQDDTTKAAGSDASPYTQRALKKQLGFDPVVGWLVVTDGPNRGRDYRLAGASNAIGRADSNQIVLSGDSTVSRDRHAFVTYEPRSAEFLLKEGINKENVYLNGETLTQTTKLKLGDRIQVGETVLVFVPLCGEHFKWGRDD